MKTSLMSSSSSCSSSSIVISKRWFSSKKQQLFQRAMKKSRLTDLCCSGRSSIGVMSSSDSEERPIMVSSTSSCSSSSTVCPTDSSWSVTEMQKSPRKRVMVVVDHSQESKTALLWALSHLVHKSDILTLLHVLHKDPSHVYDPQDSRAVVPEKARLRSEEKSCELISSLKVLCAVRQPEMDVEAVVVAGEKGPTIVRQAKKLDVSILVLGQKKLNFLQRCLRWSNKEDQLAEYCIQNADCFTLSVRRKSKQCGGYLINSKWQKNFWLLA